MSSTSPAPRQLERRACATPHLALSPRRSARACSTSAAVTPDVRAVLDRAVAATPVDADVTVVCEARRAAVDPDVLEQVVTHLLHLEAALPADASVWVTAVPAAGGLVVTVEDDAALVPERLAPPCSADLSATLRLARVSHLTRAQGGSCWIEPAVDQGLCYVVELPGRRP